MTKRVSGRPPAPGGPSGRRDRGASRSATPPPCPPPRARGRGPARPGGPGRGGRTEAGGVHPAGGWKDPPGRQAVISTRGGGMPWPVVITARGRRRRSSGVAALRHREVAVRDVDLPGQRPASPPSQASTEEWVWITPKRSRRRSLARRSRPGSPRVPLGQGMEVEARPLGRRPELAARAAANSTDAPLGHAPAFLQDADLLAAPAVAPFGVQDAIGAHQGLSTPTARFVKRGSAIGPNGRFAAGGGGLGAAGCISAFALAR